MIKEAGIDSKASRQGGQVGSRNVLPPTPTQKKLYFSII